MKEMFPQFRRQSEEDFKHVISEGIIAFDTNVLLNLYRYKAETTENLLSLLGQLSSRIWIPYHVALEFHRNRLSVIADQNRKFADVIAAVQDSVNRTKNQIEQLKLKSRHASIDPEDYLKTINSNAEEFVAKIAQSKTDQAQDLTAQDLLKEKIEKLFDGRVGDAPTEQVKLDEIYKKAEWRFKHSIPPGYKDTEKEDKCFLHNGLLYQKKYSDYLIWHQLLEKASAKPGTPVMFVTDDSKDDWWLKLEAEGTKTIGPRIELIEEALFVGKAKCFSMYSSEQFLVHGSRQMQTAATPAAVQDIREVASLYQKSIAQLFQGSDANSNHVSVLFTEENVSHAVFKWLSNLFFGVRKSNLRGTDFECFDNDSSPIGVEVIRISNPSKSIEHFKSKLERMKQMLNQNIYKLGEIIIVLEDEVPLNSVSSVVENIMKVNLNCSIRVVIGKLVGDENNLNFSALRSVSYVY